MESNLFSNLSNRENQIAMKLIEGLPNKVIGSELYISERTVKFHCANIYRKLNIRNRNMLISRYFKDKYEPDEAYSGCELRPNLAHYSKYQN